MWLAKVVSVRGFASYLALRTRSGAGEGCLCAWICRYIALRTRSGAGEGRLCAWICELFSPANALRSGRRLSLCVYLQAI